MRRLGLLLLLAAAALAGDEPKVWVHAPAKDLLSLFPEKGAGFLISLGEYKKLRELARQNEEADRERPPLDGHLARGTATARIEGDALSIDASWVAVVTGGNAPEIPFPLDGVAIESLAVEGGGELAGRTLRFAKPGSYAVSAKLSARLRRSGEIRRAEFRLPPSAGNTVRVALPPDVEGEVGPIVRAFKSGPEGGTVVGYPDERGLFKIWLEPRSPARRLDALLSASFDTVAEIGEARTATRTGLRIDVLRAPIDRVTLLLDAGQIVRGVPSGQIVRGVPSGQIVRGVHGKGVKSWKITRGDPDELEIRFTEPVQRTVQLGLETELPRDETATARVPVVRVRDAVRYRGTLGIAARPEVRVLGLDHAGARRLGAGKKAPVALFEIWSADARVTATVERVAAKTRSRSGVTLLFLEGGKRLEADFRYEITGKPLFRLEPRLPAGWILRKAHLDGKDVPHRWLADEGRLVLDFPAGLEPGRHRLHVLLDTDEVDWVPNEGAATFDLANVRSGLDEETGYLVVASDPAFRVGTRAVNGLEPVGMPEIAAQFGRTSDRILLAWRFEKPSYAASFELERHEPQIDATVVTRLLPSERLLRVHSLVRFDIRRTGVRELKVALPKGTGPLVDFDGPLIKEKRAPEEDADPETWTLELQKRVRGAYPLQIVFEKKFEDDAWSTTAPEIVLPDATERGFVVIEPSGATEITVERNGLREADVGELSYRPARPPLEVLAYARHPYDLKISSRRHDPEPVVQAIALSAHVYGVLSHEGRLRCRAEYRVRNNDQPFLGFALPKGSTLLGAIVDGKPAKPLVEGGRSKVPLPRSEKRETPFVVALVYESRTAALDEGEVTILRPALDVDVLKTTYELHLPDGYTLTGFEDGDLVPLSMPEKETVLERIRDLAALPLFVFAPKAQRADGAAVEHRITANRELSEKEREALPGEERRPKRSAARTGINPIPQEPPPPGHRDPSDPEPPPEEPVEETIDFEDSFDEGDADAPFDKPPAAPATPAGGPRPDPGAEDGKKVEVAQGDKPQRPTPAPRRPAKPKVKRPDKALLSLDISFLKPDNLVQLESLAPSGRVTLRLARVRTFDRARFLGVALALGAAVLLLLGRRRPLLRLLPAGLLLLLALHFAGLSLVSNDFAGGAAEASFFVLLGLLALRLFGAIGRRIFRSKPKAAPRRMMMLLLLATLARAEDEILVPYGDDPEKIDRVFLPADEYHRLRKLAYPETAGRATAFLTARYHLTYADGEISVRARYGIAKETDEAERIPLRLGDAALVRAEIGGEPANVAVSKKGYVLVLEGKTFATLELEVRPAPRRAKGVLSFGFPVRPVADATLTLKGGPEGHDVDVIRLGAARDGTYHLGPVGLVSAKWTPETEGFVAESAELHARTEAVASVRDGYTAVAARISYGIRGGTVERLRVRAGKDLTVRAVRTKDLAGWQVDGEGNVVVALKKPAEKSVVLEIEAERAAERERVEAYPEIAPLDVLRDTGVLAIETLDDLKIEVLASRGLLRARGEQAPSKLSAAHDRGVLHSVHRYAVRPFELRWRVQVEPTRLRAETRIDLLVERDRARAMARIRVEVERGPGPFTIPVRVPAGYEVVKAGGVRDWWVRDGILYLDRAGRQQGAATYGVVLRRRGTSDEPFTAPAVAVEGAVRETGTLRVAMADGLELEAAEAGNLLPVDVAKVGGAPWVRAYRFVSTPWRLEVSSREEPREMDALVVSRVVPGADRIHVEALVDFHVRRGLVDRFSFVVPVAEEREVLLSAPDRREIRSEPVGDDRRRFTVWLRTPTRGSTSATVSYPVPYGTPVRGVEPENAERVRRYVAVEKVPDGEVKIANARNLDAGDFDDLPLKLPESTPQTVARVYVGSGGPFELSVEVQRHAFEEIAKAVVYRAAARAVVDRSGFARVHLSYRVYNRAEQFLRLELPEDSQLYSVFVAGEGVRPLREGDDVLVPLRKLALGATAFDVDLVYTYGGPALGESDFSVRVPEVGGLDVRRTTVTLHLPRGFSYDFETEMDEVEPDDLAAGEAADLYEEIKEQYAVVERGNELQAGRALSNLRRLEQQAERLMDEVRAETGDQQKLKQIESQKVALDALRRAAPETKKGGRGGGGSFRGPSGGVPPGTRGVEEWSANEAYLRGRRGEEAKQVDAYLDKNASRAQQQEETVDRRRKDAKDAPVFAVEALGGLTGTGGGGGSHAGADAGGASLEPEAGLFFNDGADFRPPQLGDLDGDGKTDPGAPGLRTAAGRISLRIDLPKNDEVYHFAALGGEAEVEFSASEKGGRWLEGIAAVLCAAAAALLLRK